MSARAITAAALLLAASPAIAAAQEQAAAPTFFPASASPSRVTLEAPSHLGADREGSRTLLGAGVGLVAGTGITYAVLYTGNSTALCDRDANQDALTEGECRGLLALGGLVGAGIGALIGSRFGGGDPASSESSPVAITPLPSRQVAITFARAF